MPNLTLPKYGLELGFIAEGGYAEWDRRGLCGMGQKRDMQSGTEGGYGEWDRRGKGAMRNGARGGSADSGMECLT